MGRRNTILGAVGLAAVLGVGLMIPAVAQDGETTETPTETASEGETPRSERQQAFADALAEELGLDAETVAAAVDAVHEELAAAHRTERLEALRDRLDQAVEDGTLTAEQADAIYAAAESGALGALRRHHGGHHGGGWMRGGHGFGMFDVPTDTATSDLDDAA